MYFLPSEHYLSISTNPKGAVHTQVSRIQLSDPIGKCTQMHDRRQGTRNDVKSCIVITSICVFQHSPQLGLESRAAFKAYVMLCRCERSLALYKWKRSVTIQVDVEILSFLCNVSHLPSNISISFVNYSSFPVSNRLTPRCHNMKFDLKHLIVAIVTTAIITTLIVEKSTSHLSNTGTNNLTRLGAQYGAASLSRSFGMSQLDSRKTSSRVLPNNAHYKSVKADLPFCPRPIIDMCVLSVCSSDECIRECVKGYGCTLDW